MKRVIAALLVAGLFGLGCNNGTTEPNSRNTPGPTSTGNRGPGGTTPGAPPAATPGPGTGTASTNPGGTR